ncbi:MAG: STN domain-containing protein, partial [Steroidobacteraceae bacterium]
MRVPGSGQPLAAPMRALCAAVAAAVLAGAANAANAPPARAPIRIPAEDLGLALRTLAKDRGFQVVYVSGQVDHLTSHGAAGDLTVDEALTRVLRGTGLTFRRMSDSGIVIEPLATPAPHPLA